jgi:hypothetical protein
MNDLKLIKKLIKDLSELEKRQFSLGASNYGLNAGYNHNFGNGFSAHAGVNTNWNLKPTGGQVGISYRP